ncbi:hypothetical protein AGMMS49991_01960 [Spirochaetia bacterium]|nr:hypothetical protein AGMMS49991_01960 [Spirochaetia bacterium]
MKRNLFLGAAIVFAAVLGFTGCTDGGGTELPALTGTVAISGTTQVGQTLTADTGGLDGGGTTNYQWLRDEAELISGADQNTYQLAAADEGHMILVRVSRAGYSGSVTSAAKGPVTAAASPVGLSSITGNG